MQSTTFRISSSSPSPQAAHLLKRRGEGKSAAYVSCLTQHAYDPPENRPLPASWHPPAFLPLPSYHTSSAEQQLQHILGAGVLKLVVPGRHLTPPCCITTSLPSHPLSPAVAEGNHLGTVGGVTYDSGAGKAFAILNALGTIST